MRAAAAAQQPDAPTGQSRSSAANSGLELTFWQSIQASERAADFEAYLEQFPNGAFAPLARNRVAALSQQKTSPKDITGAWVSGVLTNPFNRHDQYRLRLDLKRLGIKVLGSVSRNSAEDARRK